MRLPFVSRSVYQDTLDRALKAEARSDRIQAQYHSVVERMVALKRKKKAPEKQVPIPPITPQVVIPPEVSWAIEQRASGDPALRRYLNTYAMESMAQKKTPADIAEAIRMGDSGDED